MPIQFGSEMNIVPIRSQNAQKHEVASGSTVRLYSPEEKISSGVKAGVCATTILGVGIAMLRTFKSKGMPTDLKKFCHNLTHITYDNEKHEVEKLIGRLAIGSIAGGLIGGAIFDKKENFNSKIRESIIQLVGNISIPLMCVAGAIKLFERAGGKAKSFKGVCVTALGLGSGIFVGNKVGNKINKNIFNVDDERKLKLTDLTPHLDDVCFGISLIAAKGGNKFGNIASRFIPLALMVAGISTGIAQETSKNISKNISKVIADKN